MSVKPGPEAHKLKIQLALFRRDHNIMAEYYPEILEVIEAAVSGGVTADSIKGWALKVSDEGMFIQRIYNAARWLEHERVEAHGEAPAVFVGVDMGSPEGDKTVWVERSEQ